MAFKFTNLSKKQKQVLTWWMPESPKKNCDIIVAHGAIRAGKTLIMSLSYVLWAMASYNEQNFIMTGKTIGSFKRNVWFHLKPRLKSRGYKISKVTEIGEDVFKVSKGNVSNYFYIFGGKDERSQDLVQGLTAAGLFCDEVALQPESFIMQATARCSVEGAKFWFNCNPAGPFHWFKVGWLDKLEEMNGFEIHFLLEDNPSLKQATIDKYKNRYKGVFYLRYILGLWVMAEGLVYSMFDRDMVINEVPKGVKIHKKWIAIDYGQSNATVFLLIGIGSDEIIYILDEYYHEGKKSSIQKSPSAYSKEYNKFLYANGEVDEAGTKYPVNKAATYIDPSAKGFMLQLHEDGHHGIQKADNDVLRGIELTSAIIEAGRLRVLKKCKNTIQEFSSYSWDPKAQERGEDKPIKQFDHAMDALRYFVNANRLMLQKLVVKYSQNKAA